MKIRLDKHHRALLLAAGAAWAACGVPNASRAATLSDADFQALAARCAPGVAVGTLEGVAKTESRLDPLTLHNNTTGVSKHEVSTQAALEDASAWIGRGDSVDLGLMQVNSANLPGLNMTVQAAFDGCASLASGAAILQAAYGGGQTNAEQQAALLMALSRYNTGSPFRGILNGYARKVIANADHGAVPPPSTAVTTEALAAPRDPNAPPSWNVWANASYAQTHGATWLIPLSPGAAPKAKPMKAPSTGQTAEAAQPEAVFASIQAPSTQPTERSP